MSDKLIDFLDYSNPFKFKGINLYSPTSSSFPKELQIYFTNSFIENDVGFLQEKIEIIRDVVFTDMRETSYFNNQNVLVRALFRI